MKILHLISAYAATQYSLNEDNLCIVNVRNEEERLATIEEMLNKFLSIPWVEGCGGLIESYVFDTETRIKTNLDVYQILSLPDDSVTDSETLVKIGLLTTRFDLGLTKDEIYSITRKPKKGFEFGCLYPHTQK